MRKLTIPAREETFKHLKEIIHGQSAKEFNKRDSGLRLKTFLLVFTVSICSLKKVTLEGLALKCQNLQYGLSLTKQAREKRLKKGSKALENLLSDVVGEVYTKQMNTAKTAPVLEQFDAVHITDATVLSLPTKLAAHHKGLGGTNAASAMKIQASYDIKSKRFTKTAIRENATENDASYMAEWVKCVNRNELSIADLGYYSVSHFKTLAEKGAYFMSKIKSNTILYDEHGEIIDMVRLLKKNGFLDRNVIIKGDAGKTVLTVRFCGVKLPSKEYAERIRKANKAAKASSKTLTKEELERLKWILIITNVSDAMMNCQAVCEVYRIRWQIEIIFKSWKSYFSIDEMTNVGKHYLDCMLYGKLVIITILTAMYAKMHFLVFQTTQRYISYLRFMKNMIDALDMVLDFLASKCTVDDFCNTIIRISSACLVEKRKRKTSEQTIADFDVPGLALEAEVVFELELEMELETDYAA